MIGGRPVAPSEFLYFVRSLRLLIHNSLKFLFPQAWLEIPDLYCGGTLISEMFVVTVTAAHCFGQTGLPLADMYGKICAGSANLTNIDEKVCRPISRIVIHPKYKAST